MTLVGFPRDTAITIVRGEHPTITVTRDDMDDWGVHHCEVTNGSTHLAVEYTVNEAGVHMFTLGVWPEVNFRIVGVADGLEQPMPDSPVERYIADITWSPFAGDWEKHIVATHLRRFAGTHLILGRVTLPIPTTPARW